MSSSAGSHARGVVCMALATLVGLALAVLPGPAGAAPTADPVVRVGTIKVVHEDDFANGRSTRRLMLRADGKDFMLDGVNPDTGPKAGSTVRVAGAQQGSSIEVSGITSLAPPAAAAAPISGQRRIAVVLFNFTNNASRPFTAADALARVFTGPDSANGYYQEASNGALSLVGRNSPAGDVFGWYTIPQTNFTCDQIGWGNAARSSVASDGHDLSAYDNVVYVFPKTTSCSWAGLAYIGGGPYGMGEAWSNGYLDTGVITHELGHNFGMNHASTLTCTVDGRRVTAAEGCVADEYGDQSDVMGNAWAAQHSGSYYGRHPGSWHSLQAGLQPGSALTTISASGDYTLASGETDTGTRSLMVALVNLPGWYYAFDLRTPEGRFDDFPAGAPVVQGVTVRLVSWPWNGSGGIPVNSYLLDTTPDTATFDDAAIPVGREFYDPTYGRLAIRVKSVTGGMAVVHADLDLTGTSVLSVDPSANVMAVPLDRNIVVTFSGPVDRSSVQAAFALYQQPSATTKVPGQFSWDAASTVLTFDPSPYLLPGTPYDVAIGPGALGASGRPVVASQRTSFITDGTGPRVLSTDPIAGATAVPVDQNVTVTFAGPVDRPSAQAAFSLQKTGTRASLGGSFAWNASSTVMTFDPYAKLFEATGYTVSEAASVKDVAGNPMAGPFSSAFTSGGQAPSVSGVDPLSGASGVAVDRNIVVSFSEAMERNSAQNAFSLRSTGTTANLGGSFSWDLGSTVMTYNPYANLAANTSYTVAEAASATDIGGNPMVAGLASTFNSDAQPPTVTLLDPLAGATDVPVDRNVVVTFSEPVERNSAQVAFSLQKTGTPGSLGGSFTWNAGSTVMTFDPYANLLANSAYTVSEGASVKDVAGNAMVAVAMSSFRTDAQGPTLVTDPAAGTAGVPVDRNVVSTFSEPVDRPSAQAAFSLQKTGTPGSLGGAFSWDTASKVMTFNPYANLFEASGYTVAVAASVRDVAGNPMVGPYSSVFSTSGQLPSVTGVDPLGGATAVAVDRNIVVSFTEAMERNSAQNAFSLRSTGATANLGGSIRWDVSSTVMTFNPYANLAAGSSYTVAEAATATDIGGNPMAAGFTAAFRTAP